MDDSAKILTETMRSRNSFLILLFLVLTLFVFHETTYAQNAPKDKSLRSYKLPSNIKRHLVEKYKKSKDRIDSVMSNLQETPRGPRGRLSFRGHISLYTAKAGSGDPAARARAIANAFLKDEAELFGLPDVNELREQRLTIGDTGYTHIYYTRYIDNLPLEHSDVHIVIAPDEAIFYVDVSLVPVPSELYAAVTNKTIPETVARQIIEKDARTKNADIKRFKSGKLKIYAIPSAPYAVWKGSVSLGGGKRWEYDVNAFTGEIINLRKLLLGEHE